jgi:hypothetical protein
MTMLLVLSFFGLFGICEARKPIRHGGEPNFKNVDFTSEYFWTEGDPAFRTRRAWDEVMGDYLERNEIDTFGWIMLGNLYAGNGMSDFSHQAYYMAYLKDPKRFRTNSELPFETYIGADAQAKNERATDELLSQIVEGD